jgi:hypothetical protein
MALDPEELLWKPTKTIFIPPVPAITWDQLSARVLTHIVPKLADAVFIPSPIFEYLRWTEEKLYEATSLPGYPYRIMVQDQVEALPNHHVQQSGQGIHGKHGALQDGPGRAQIHLPASLQRGTGRTVHRRPAEGSKGLVYPVFGTGPSV